MLFCYEQSDYWMKLQDQDSNNVLSLLILESIILYKFYCADAHVIYYYKSVILY
jgi:hypothetical protein